MVQEDPHIKQLIPSEIEGQEKNPLISKFKDEVMNQLYSNIEIVLLNTKGENLPKNLIQERLAEITNVKKTGQNQNTT